MYINYADIATPWSVTPVFVFVSTPHQVSPIAPYYPLCIFTPVFSICLMPVRLVLSSPTSVLPWFALVFGFLNLPSSDLSACPDPEPTPILYLPASCIIINSETRTLRILCLRLGLSLSRDRYPQLTMTNADSYNYFSNIVFSPGSRCSIYALQHLVKHTDSFITFDLL